MLMMSGQRKRHVAAWHGPDESRIEHWAVCTMRHWSSVYLQRLSPRHRELVHHAALQGHPHIVALREAFITDSHLAVVLEYAGE